MNFAKIILAAALAAIVGGAAQAAVTTDSGGNINVEAATSSGNINFRTKHGGSTLTTDLQVVGATGATTASGVVTMNSNQNGFGLTVNNTNSLANVMYGISGSSNSAVSLIRLDNSGGQQFNVFADGSVNLHGNTLSTGQITQTSPSSPKTIGHVVSTVASKATLSGLTLTFTATELSGACQAGAGSQVIFGFISQCGNSGTGANSVCNGNMILQCSGGNVTKVLPISSICTPYIGAPGSATVTPSLSSNNLLMTFSSTGCGGGGDIQVSIQQ